MTSFNTKIIGYIHTPYKDKFAVPRQAMIVEGVKSTIVFDKPYNDAQAFSGLSGFSHLHVIWAFDHIEASDDFKSMVRPPRLGGNQKVGVFASRSPFRPSRLGLSIVKLEHIIYKGNSVELEVLGADMVDGTAIIDIKPYIPFVDIKLDAKAGFALDNLVFKKVVISPQLEQHQLWLDSEIRDNIKAILSCDPRPAYKATKQDDKIYEARLYDHAIRFKVEGEIITIVGIEEI